MTLPETIRVAAFTAAAVSVLLHARWMLALDRRAIRHAADAHEGDLPVPLGRGAGHLAERRIAWRSARSSGAGYEACTDCAALLRDRTWCGASFIGSAFVLLAIAEIWGS